MSDFDLNVFFELHAGLARQAPGSETSTRRAFSLLVGFGAGLPERPRVLDIGCGPGAQALVLARLGCEVTAVDNHAPFLRELEQRAHAEGLAEHIQTVEADMRELPFEPASFDLLWAEGSIYNMGFEEGLRAWRPLLKDGGRIALTELTWLKPEPPEEVERFWAEGYPAMRSVGENLAALHEGGFEAADWFVLPESNWWDEYYGPLEKRLEGFGQDRADSPTVQATLAAARREIDMYRRFSDFYGYVFYLGVAADF